MTQHLAQSAHPAPAKNDSQPAAERWSWAYNLGGGYLTDFVDEFPSREAAIADAQSKGHAVIHVGKLVPADPTKVMPPADWIIGQMLDASSEDDQGGMFQAGDEDWLENVGKFELDLLDQQIQRTIVLWLRATGRWPDWSHIPDLERVEIAEIAPDEPL